MGRRTLLNHLGIKFDPSTSEVMAKNLIGKEKFTIALAAETTLDIDCGCHHFFDVTLGGVGVTINFTTTGVMTGEKFLFKLTQAATPRAVTWGTGVIEDLTPSAIASAVDLYEGVFDGTNIILGAIAQNVS